MATTDFEKPCPGGEGMTQGLGNDPIEIRTKGNHRGWHIGESRMVQLHSLLCPEHPRQATIVRSPSPLSYWFKGGSTEGCLSRHRIGRMDSYDKALISVTQRSIDVAFRVKL